MYHRFVMPCRVTATSLIALAIALRLALILQGWPVLNSDEATWGLMAAHIARASDAPAFMYGQAYMGALEAYLGAALFTLFGISLISLRLGAVILFALFLASIYHLSTLLYNRATALLSLLLLCFGSQEMLFRQLEVAGGYPEVLLGGGLLLVLSCQLALSSAATDTGPRIVRLLAYGAWGLVAGLASWSDPLVMPFLAMAGLALLLFCGGELWGWAGLTVCVGTIVGTFPLVVYNFSVSPEHSTIAALARAFLTGGTGAASSHGSTLEHFSGTFGSALPLVTGASPLYRIFPSSWVLPSGTKQHSLIIAYAVWGAGIVVLWTFAGWESVRDVLRAPAPIIESAADQVGKRRVLRLLVLAAGGITVAFFLASEAPIFSPRYGARYLVGLWICLPGLLFPLLAWRERGRIRRLSAGLRNGLALAAVLATLLRGTAGVFSRDLAQAQATTAKQDFFVATLIHDKVRHMYSDYWTCNRVTFQSRERIRCAVLHGNLRPGYDRYPPYRQSVRGDVRAAYAFPNASTLQRSFAAQRRIGHCYSRRSLDGYVVYLSRNAPNSCARLSA